jgi:hypothetical protein
MRKPKEVLRMWYFRVALLICVYCLSAAALLPAQEGDAPGVAPISISSIEPERITLKPDPTPVIIIHGAGFTRVDIVRFIIEEFDKKSKKVITKSVNATVDKKEPTVLVVRMPKDISDQSCTIIELLANNGTVSVTKKIPIIKEVVAEAIRMRQSSFYEEPFIAEHLFQKKNDEVKDIFGNIKLSKDEMGALKSEKFSDDFIAKMEGHPQYITLGLSAIWLKDTTELVGAPMIRIFLVPKSYYTSRKNLWEKHWGVMLPTGILYVDKWDLNIGYTSSASISKDNGVDNKKKNYILLGLSYEINPSALFNIGVAYVPGDVDGVQKQLYFGFTIDQNILKQVGIMNN